MRNIQQKKLNIFHEGAVSEAIGFLLIFSLVMMGIGLIILYGYPILLETQTNANVRNMERDMIVLQNDMKGLVYKNVPYKETSLQVSGGSLAVHNYLTTIAFFTISNGTELYNGTCGHLIYESDAGEAIIALENGAVLTRMEFQQGSAMLAEPRWFIDEINGNKTFIITLMNISSDSVMSRNGIGTVKMRVIDSVFEQIAGTDMDVEVTYSNDITLNFAKAWENYFVNTLKMNKSGSNYTASGIDNLVIKQYNIKIISI